MRTSYNVADEMDFVPMDQVRSWIVLAGEYAET
jgi:hypothetical protein